MSKFAFGIAALAVLASPAAAAQYIVNFDTTSTFLGGPQTLRSTITTSNTSTQILGQTGFAITGISGTLNGAPITGLFDAPGNPTYYLFTTGPTFLDGSGVRFNAGGYTNIAFFHQDNVPATEYRINGGGTVSAFGTASATAVAAAVPEPATWAMMIGGFGAIGGTLRYRRRKVSVSFARA